MSDPVRGMTHYARLTVTTQQQYACHPTSYHADVLVHQLHLVDPQSLQNQTLLL
jgi:hypothetical protein